MKRRFVTAIFILAFATAGSGGFAQGRRALRPEKAKDPVCGLMVDKDPKLAMTYRSQTYFFCSRTDLELFRKNPERYVRK